MADSKLRAHIDDVRQEAKRQLEMCKLHTSELEEHRVRVAALSQDQGSTRDSLLAAKAQVVTLKAQLDKAVDKKVNKKLGGSSLKVSNISHCIDV
jgi:hypothetical protein